jgi:HSP20 family protein
VERRYGSFRRVIAIGNQVDADKVEAAYKDGVLTVNVPKAAAAQPKRIQIKT